MAKHDATLAAIFEDETRANIRWADIVALFRSLGGTTTEARGSRVKVVLNGKRHVFHSPHPGKQATKPLIRDVRDYLTEAGVKP